MYGKLFACGDGHMSLCIWRNPLNYTYRVNFAVYKFLKINLVVAGEMEGRLRPTETKKFNCITDDSCKHTEREWRGKELTCVILKDIVSTDTKGRDKKNWTQIL